MFKLFSFSREIYQDNLVLKAILLPFKQEGKIYRGLLGFILQWTDDIHFCTSKIGEQKYEGLHFTFIFAYLPPLRGTLTW